VYGGLFKNVKIELWWI